MFGQKKEKVITPEEQAALDAQKLKIEQEKRTRAEEVAHLKEVRERKKREQIRREGHNAFWYLVPGNLRKEQELIGGNFSFKSNIATWLIWLIVAAGFGIFFDLEVGYIIALVVIMALFIPAIIVMKYRAKYQDKRFQDVNIYMEQFLYSFREKKKVVSTLVDIRNTFNNSPIGPMIDDAVDKIMAPGAKEDVEVEALKEIEGSYPTEKVLTIHKFALRVEKIGGNFDSTSKLLLRDRNSWELRNEMTRAAKRGKMKMVTISIFVSLALCGLLVRLLPMALDGLSIAHIPIIELMSVFIFFLDMFIYTKVLKMTNKDLLTLSIEEEEDAALRRYYKIANWKESVQFLKSLRYAVFPAILFALFAFLGATSPTPSKLYTALMIVSAVIAVVMLFQHKIDYMLTKKGVEKQIMEMFPRWLIDIALLLQTDNVQVALYKSFEDAPTILKPELKKLYDALEKNPTDIQPYLDFMDGFDVRGIQSAMKMLYNIYSGNYSGENGNSDEQISEIVQRNDEMVSFVEQQNDNNAIGAYSGLMLIPVLTAGLKLLVDMMFFFFTMMSYMASNI